jgi:hypothetical protein
LLHHGFGENGAKVHRSLNPARASRACGVALERAPKSRRQSADHADVDGVGLGDLGQRLAGRPALDGFLALVLRQLRLPAELDAGGLGALAAVACAFADEVALELSYGGKKRREQPSLRRGRIPERVTERAERGAGIADALDQVQKLAGAAA